MSQSASPTPPNRFASLLTYAGVLPFLILSFYQCFYPGHSLLGFNPRVLFQAYAAVILSFLAGIHWGIALQNPARCQRTLFVSSNLIALLAWGTLFKPLHLITSCVLMLAFLYQLLFDACLWRQGLLATWFFRLRLSVTLPVMLSLALMV